MPNPVPLTVTVVPPAMVPLVGETEVTVGVAAKASGTATTVSPAAAISEATNAFARVDSDNQRERATPIDPNPPGFVVAETAFVEIRPKTSTTEGGVLPICVGL